MARKQCLAHKVIVRLYHYCAPDHEEADTRLLLQAKHASQTHPRIVIQSFLLLILKIYSAKSYGFELE